MLDKQATTFTMEAVAVLEALQRTKMSISDEETRYYLAGIHVSRAPDGKGMRFCATDGCRLCLYRVDGEYPDYVNAILSRAAIELLIAGIKKLKRRASVVGISFECLPKTWRANIAGDVIDLPLIDGTFPDYDRVIPTDNDKTMSFQVEDFTKACQSLLGFCKPTDQFAVKLAATGKALVMSVNESGTDATKGRAAWPVKLAGEIVAPFEIGFNVQYLFEYAKRLEYNFAIEMRYSDAGSPTLFNVVGDKAETFVLMPMRV